MLGTWIVAAALATPCAPIESANFLEGDHFWIEWDPAVCDTEAAQQILDWSEEARTIYMDELGYAFTDQTILIRVEDFGGVGGLATTVACPDGSLSPLLTLYAANIGDPGENTSKHEVVHAVQYAYMGSYIDGITSWPWWMEGCAMWTTTFADDNFLEWAGRAEDYLETPWIGLHQTPLAYSDPQRSRFLYGTGLIAQFLSDADSPEAVRRTWEYGQTVTGTPIYFPDAIEAAGLEWEPFWTDFMAAVTVLDIPQSNYFSEAVFVEDKVGSLPAQGSPDEEREPQGMGLSVVHFRKVVGQPGRDLEVTFEGDPDVPWMAVLVRTRGKGPGGKVLDVVPVEVGADGKGQASLTEFDGTKEGWLVVSPQSLDLEPREFTWSAQLNELPTEEEPKGCGCDSTGGLGWAWLGALLLWRRREP